MNGGFGAWVVSAKEKFQLAHYVQRFLASAGEELRTFRSLDGSELVPYQCVVVRQVWPWGGDLGGGGFRGRGMTKKKKKKKQKKGGACAAYFSRGVGKRAPRNGGSPFGFAFKAGPRIGYLQTSKRAKKQANTQTHKHTSTNMPSPTHQHTNTRTHDRRNTETQKHRNTETQKHRNTETQKCRNAEMQKCRNTNRNTETETHDRTHTHTCC